MQANTHTHERRGEDARTRHSAHGCARHVRREVHASKGKVLCSRAVLVIKSAGHATDLRRDGDDDDWGDEFEGDSNDDGDERDATVPLSHLISCHTLLPEQQLLPRKRAREREVSLSARNLCLSKSCHSLIHSLLPCLPPCVSLSSLNRRVYQSASLSVSLRVGGTQCKRVTRSVGGRREQACEHATGAQAVLPRRCRAVGADRRRCCSSWGDSRSRT